MKRFIHVREEEVNPESRGASPEMLQITEASGAVMAAPTGSKWRVRVFEYGLSTNRYEYSERGKAKEHLQLKWTPESARAALPHLDGARCFADHAADGHGQSVRNLIGFYSEPQLGAKGPEATLTVLESEDWAQRKMLAAWKIGRPLGFSVDAMIAVKPVGEGAVRALAVEEIAAIKSCDLVSAASSGGAPLAVLEGGAPAEQNPGGNPAGAVDSSSSNGATTKKEQTMKERIKRVLESLRKLPAAVAFKGRIDAVEAELNQEGVKIDEVLIGLAEELAAAQPAAENGAATQVAAVQEQVRALQTQIGEAQKRQLAAERALTVKERLDASKLPGPALQNVREWCDGREFTPEQLDAQIKKVREQFAAVAANNPTRISGRPVIEMGLERGDKLQIALDRMFGVTHKVKEERNGQMVRMVQAEEVDKSVPSFRSLKEAYIAYTGDSEVRSQSLGRRVQEAADIDSTSFPQALNDTLGRLLLQDYRQADYDLSMFYETAAVPDFKDQKRIRIGDFDDLPAHDPEAAPWPNLTPPTDEQATYAVVQFGAILSISRKMIKNDDLGTASRMVGKIGRAARRTLAQYVTTFFVANAAIYDGTTWFHANHGNLGATALSATELGVIRAAFRAFAEKDSLKKLGLMPYWLMIPDALEGAALKANKSAYLSDSLADDSTVQFMFGQNGERIVRNHLLTDNTDYYVIGRKEDAPILEVGFLDGRMEPEFFLADGETTSEAMLTADELRYKVRYEFGGAPIDYRNVYKEVVAG